MKSKLQIRKRHNTFAQAFESHVASFIKQYRLFENEKKIVLAVSGGVDSLSLGQVLARKKINFELLHFNHGTRAQHNFQEEQFVSAKAMEWGVKLRVFRQSFSLDMPNFEAHARQWRKSIYTQIGIEGALIVTAHHLDDSYEWSLMQGSRQASLSSTLGIPLKSQDGSQGGIRRPFLCVTKKQILRYARATELSWLEDHSNRDVRFERNFIREHITNIIAKKYPRYLRHYVAQKNEQALSMGVHAQLQSQSEINISVDPSNGVLLKATNFHQHKAEIKKWIISFSVKKRGEIDHELDKLLMAQNRLQNKTAVELFKGPMIFSGGVMIYVMQDSLFIMGEKQKKYFSDLDQNIKNQLSKLSQIPFGHYPFYPELFVGNNRQLKKENKIIHPLLPKTCEWLKHNKVTYAFTPLISDSIRKVLLHNVVILGRYTC